MRFRLAVTMFLALAACPKAPEPSSGITGDLITRFILADGGVLDLPEDLESRTVTLYLDAADGGLEIRSARGTDAGTFTIPSVPDGRFILAVADALISTTTRQLHLGANFAGRPGVFAANPGEGLRLTASNLAPWTQDDELQLTSWNAGIDAFSTTQSPHTMREHAPDAGDTSLGELWLDLEGYGVVEASKGDDLTLLQLSAHSSAGGLTWKSVTRAAPLGVDFLLNQPTPVTVALADVPQRPVTARFDVTSFEAARADVHPDAVPLEARWLLDAHLGAFGPNTISTGAPDLAIVSAGPDAGGVALDLTWGNPFPSSFTPFVSVAVRFEALYRAPQPDGGFSPARSETAVIAQVLPLDSVTSVIGAPLTPVRNVRVDDVVIDEHLPVVKLTPVVSWDAPQRGTPTLVDIQVVALDPGPVTKRVEGPTLRVVGDVSRVRLPPGFIDAGSTQYLRVTAISQPPSWSPSIPRRDVGPPAATATAMTRAFVAQPKP